MIVVVEGPSASGKTTWCQAQPFPWLPEPGRLAPAEVETSQLRRWAEAVSRSAAGEVVILDGDPFKLWYDLALWRMGHISEPEWRASAEAARARFVAGDYGFADMVLYDDPGQDELIRRKAADSTRARSRFDLHLAMRPFMQAWYEAVDSTDPGRVWWGPRPSDPASLLARVTPRTERSAPSLVDTVLGDLAAVRSADAGRPDDRDGPRPRRGGRGLQ